MNKQHSDLLTRLHYAKSYAPHKVAYYEQRITEIITRKKKPIKTLANMRTIETIVYQFNELSSEAQQKAINNLSYINVDSDWWENTYYDAKQIGLKITSSGLDGNRHAKGEFLLAANEVAANIFKEHGEDCETYKTATKFMEDWQPVFAEYMDEESEKYESSESEDELKDLEEEFLNSLLEDYAMILEKECEYLQSSEAVKETILANDYEFTEDGKII